jgi:uncharacterized protein (TIGR02246 family)
VNVSLAHRKTTLFVLAALSLALLVSRTVAGRDDGKEAAAEAAIRQVVDAYVRTWNAHDVKAWGALFTDDSDYVSRGGDWWRSNRENVERHASIHEALVAHRQPTTYRSSVAKVSFLKPDVALVHATWEWPGFRSPSGQEQKDFRGVMTMVMLEQAGRWRIRAAHDSAGDGAEKAARPTEAVRLRSFSLHDIQGLFGGTALWASEDRTAIVQVVFQGSEKRRRVRLTDAQWAEVERLVTLHGFLTLKLTHRDGAMDEATPTITVTTKDGTTAEVWKWIGEKHPDFDAVLAYLRGLARLDGDLVFEGAYSEWRPEGFERR